MTIIQIWILFFIFRFSFLFFSFILLSIPFNVKDGLHWMEFTDRTEMDYFRELVKGIFHYMGPLNAPLSISEQIWHPNFASSKPFSNPAAAAKCESASTNGVEMKWTDIPKWITTQQHRRLIKPSLCRQKKKNPSPTVTFKQMG